MYSRTPGQSDGARQCCPARVVLPLRLDKEPKVEDDEVQEECNEDFQNSFNMSHNSTEKSSVVSKVQKTSDVIAHDFIKMMFDVLGKDKIPTLKELCYKWRVKPK
eukprot:Tbor_TRINITY_DN5497_c0_g3::TRINITY_DN5497_c0_g3_i1::g.24840::m.24840